MLVWSKYLKAENTFFLYLNMAVNHYLYCEDKAV